MRVLLQRVRNADVNVNDNIVGKIKRGLVLLVGFTHSDTETEVKWLTDKCINLRIFEDDSGKFNRSALDVNGEILVVSQFTLYSDARKGRRPSFIEAAPPKQAEELYHKFVQYLRKSKLRVQTGIFGAAMLVSIENDGPVTLMLEKEVN